MHAKKALTYACESMYDPGMAKQKVVSNYAAKGGKARASVLTPEERSEIAKAAAHARWGSKNEGQEQASGSPGESRKPLIEQVKVSVHPIALFPGKLQMGNVEFAVYVLDNGKRVMAQREVVRVLTGRGTGKLDNYIGSQNLHPYIESTKVADEVVQFTIPGTQYKGNGFEGTLLLDICDAFLRARADRVLTENQLVIAAEAEVITRACAKVGIIALIDEATGYQKFRKKQELQLKLQAFIAEDMQEWARMFPDEFWFELARLESVHYSPRNRPLRWGKYVMAFVYDSIDEDVGKALREKNPGPRFHKNHHQWLKEFGRQKVHDQIQKVVTIMKLCEDMADFREKFKRVFKKSSVTPQMNFDFGGRFG